MKFKIIDPIYNLELTVCIGVNFTEIENELLESGLPPLDDEQKPGKLTNAECIFPTEWNRIGWLWISGRYEIDDPKWQGTIAHEMFHVAIEVFRAIGTSEICEHSEEPFAYYLKFLVSEFYKKARGMKTKKAAK